MYSPESNELRRTLSRVATIAFVLALIAFPVYLLFFEDSHSPPAAPRIVTEMPQPMIDPLERVPEDILVEPEEKDTPPEPRRPQQDLAETPERREPVERERPPLPAPAPSIVGDTSVEFPQTIESRGVVRSYTVRNQGARPLEVRRIRVTGDAENAFTVRDAESFTLRPNEVRDIEIEFLPLTRGEKRATLTIESNDPRQSTFRVTLRGEAVGEETLTNVVRNLYEEGRRHFESRQFRLAEELYSNVLSIDPFYGPAYLMRGRARYEQGDYLAAVEDFDNVLKYRLSLPRADRERIECITLYYAALSLTERTLRTENREERQRLLRPALGRWEDFKGVCTIDATLVENANFWVQRLQEAR